MVSSADELVALLRNIELQSREEAEGLPQQRDLTRYWEGIVFSVAGSRLVVALDEVSEIFNDVPSLARVPGAKSWIKGVANIRGNLMPIADLQEFLGGRAIVVGRRSRILLVNDEGLSVGLLISNVQGMRHFPETGRKKAVGSNEAVQPYVTGGFAHDGEEWPIFSMKKLLTDPAFQVAAK